MGELLQSGTVPSPVIYLDVCYRCDCDCAGSSNHTDPFATVNYAEWPECIPSPVIYISMFVTGVTVTSDVNVSFFCERNQFVFCFRPWKNEWFVLFYLHKTKILNVDVW
jgi:hypothetical protein